MSNCIDVAIIGGGVVGTAIARELSRYRLTVALLEKEEELAFGVSKSNSGIIHPGIQNPPGSLKGRLCVQGNMLVRRLARELGIDFKQTGELVVAFDQEELATLGLLKRQGEELGVPGLRIVDKKWLREHEPNLNPAAVAALFAPSAGIISPYRMAYDLSENAQRNGVLIYTGAQVERIERTDERALPSGHRFELVTGRGIFLARFVVNAAGLHADTVAAMAGIRDFTIRPRKGEEYLLDKKREHLSNHLIFPVPAKHSKGVLIIKTSDGNPMIGPTACEVGDKDDRTTTEEGLRHVLESARRLVPSVNDRDIIAYFAGLRPVAGEDFIIRHEEKVPGMVTVAGIQSPGLTASPAIALLVTDILGKHGLQLRRKLFFRRRRSRTTHLFSLPLSKTARLVKKDPAYGDIVCRCEMVSAKEVREAVRRGARTMDGVKFRTRAQAGRCHGSFCTTRIMKILAEERLLRMTEVTKRGKGTELVKEERGNG